MSLTRLALRFSTTVFSAILILAMAGLLSYLGLAREASPDVTIPTIIVTVPYPGVSPADVETLLTIPVEKKLNEIKDIQELRSTSAEGTALVFAEFESGYDMDEALRRVREKVDQAGPDLPADAEEPMVTEINVSEFPIMTINLFGDRPVEELKELAEDLEDRIETVDGILDIDLVGGRERIIEVVADPGSLNAKRLTFDEIEGAVQAENVNIPGGRIEVGDASFIVRIPGEFDRVPTIERITVDAPEGDSVRLGDVARVEDTFADISSYARMNGKRSVSLQVQKRAGENLLRIADEVFARLAAFEATLPGDVEAAVTGDQSERIRDQVAELENNILSGLILVVGVLFFFLGLRNSLFVAFAIPMSMLLTFLSLDLLGITLNMVVLFSLILALGMLVDNAIVIVENVYRHMELGKPRGEASLVGTGEVAWPVISSTATTVGAFAPLLLWPGVIGEFMGFLPLTLILALASSLFVALVMTPVLCAAFMRVKTGEQQPPVDRALNRFLDRYEGALRWALDRPWRVLATGVVALFGSIALFAVSGLGVEFFPETDPPTAIIKVEFPDGTRLARTDTYIAKLERILDGMPDVKHYTTSVGTSGGGQGQMGGGGGAANANRAQITVDFVDMPERRRPSPETIRGLREKVGNPPGVQVEIVKQDMGPPVGKPVNVEVRGEDYAQLIEWAGNVRKRIAAVAGVVDLQDDVVLGRPEVAIDVDRQAAKLRGLDTRTIAMAVRTAVNGREIGSYREGEDEYDIVLRFPEDARDQIEDLNAILVPDQDGIPVPLGSVAKPELRGGYGTIRRIDRKRVVTISSGVVEGANANAVRAEVRSALGEMELPAGIDWDMTGESEEQAEAGGFLAGAFGWGIAAIALVLITQFNSVLIPAVVLSAVVLSLNGVFLGLLATLEPFGVIMTGLGVISLAGIVVNNAIVLIDFVLQAIAEGTPEREAIVQAGRVRLRPVILTAATTVLGLIPLAIGLGIDFFAMEVQIGGESSAWWRPMAVAVIFGLTIATVLTLIVVPVMYQQTARVGRWLVRMSGGGN